MATIRVDYAALGAMAEQLRPLPDQLSAVRQEISAVRGSTAQIGDPAAASMSDELLRQLSWFVDMAGVTTAGLTRALLAAARDYAAAEQIVVRVEGT